MKTNEIASFEREILEFAKGTQKSLGSLYRMILLTSKLVQILIKRPVLRKQIAPDKFEDVEQWRNYPF